MKKKGLILSLLAIYMLTMVLCGSAFAAPSKVLKGNGTIEPFKLGVQALKGQDTTDLYLNVTSDSAAYSIPQTLQKVQLKSLDKDGELVYTKNLFDVPVVDGKASIQLNDVNRFQTLKTMVLAKTGQTVDQEILNGEAKVLLRPDLNVKNITAPAEVIAGSNFSVQVITEEKNGDVGANCKVEILNGDQVLDTANAVQVSPGGSIVSTFLLKFTDVGTYNLKTRISGVTPADYDLTNNEANFTVKIVPSTKPLNYWSSYNNNRHTFNRDSYYYWGGGTPYSSYRSDEKYEYFEVQYSTSETINPDGTLTLKINSEDGNVQDLTFSNITLQENYYNKTFSQFYPDINGHLSIEEYPGYTSVYFYRSAGNITYSENWNYYWYGNNYHYEYGQFMNAEQNLTVELTLPDQSGTVYGGSYTLNLQSYNYPFDYWYSDWYWYWNDSYHIWGADQGYNGWGSGMTAIN